MPQKKATNRNNFILWLVEKLEELYSHCLRLKWPSLKKIFQKFAQVDKQSKVAVLQF